MNENDKHFIKRYKELLDKGYCDCNEMNCIDNNSPRRILNIVNNLQSKIDKVNELLEERKERVEDISWVEMKVENYIQEINEIEFILKEDK